MHNSQLTNIHLIKPPSDPDKQVMYYVPNQKGNPTPMSTITQDYEDDDTLEPKISYPDNQCEEEAAEVLLRRSPCLMQSANFISRPSAGISQAALNSFMGNSYMQELQQSIANNADPI